MKQGDYLLTAALGKTIYRVEELKPMLHELKGIGRNLNQLTILAHKGQISAVSLSEATRALTKTIQVINGLYDVVDGRIASGKATGETDDGNL